MLNVKQEKFIQNIVKGMSQREAYKNAYKVNYDENAIDNNASKLFNKDEVQTRYKELLKELEDKSIMSAKDRMVWLTKVVNGEIKHTSYDSNGNAYDNEAYISDKLKSIDILNKMSGEYITKVDASVESDVTINIELSDD